MTVGLCMPSRGLIFSKTVQSVVSGMRALAGAGIASQVVFSHDLPIPESFNYVVEQSFQNKSVDRIVFIEEDMYVEEEAFVALCTSEFDVATLQYNDKNGSPHGIIHYDEQGKILWCGFGATMIKRYVFEKISQPWFRDDVRYKVIKKMTGADGRKIVTQYEPMEARSEWGYGGHDVDFYTRVNKAGFIIHQIPNYKAQHFMLVTLGKDHMNHGVHDIQTV